MNKYNEALMKCTPQSCNTFKVREWMKKPFTINTEAYATNGYMMLIVPKEKTTGIEELCDYPQQNIIKVIPFDKVNNLKRHEFSLKQLEKVVDQISKIDEMSGHQVECKNCHGSGVIECLCCGQDRDCPDCEGEGYYDKSRPTGKRLPSPVAKIKITYCSEDIYFQCRAIINLIEITKTLKVNSLSMIYSSPDTACLFVIGYCTLLVMPSTHLPDDEIVEFVLGPDYRKYMPPASYEQKKDKKHSC